MPINIYWATTQSTLAGSCQAWACRSWWCCWRGRVSAVACTRPRRWGRPRIHSQTHPSIANQRKNQSIHQPVSQSVDQYQSIHPSIKKNIYNANSKQASTRLESVAQTVARWHGILSYTTERNASIILQSWTECWYYVNFIIGHNISNHGFIIAPTFSQSVYTIQITCISQHPSYKQ